MFCTNCGAPRKEGETCCSSCGYQFKKVPVQTRTLVTVEKTARNTTATTPAAKIDHTKLYLLIISVVTLFLMFQPWVRFLGGMSGKYSLFNLPNVAVKNEDFFYWFLYDIWDHNGAREFLSFANSVKTMAIMMVLVHVVHIGVIVTDNKYRGYVTSVAAVWSWITTIYFLGWMFWFKDMLVRLDEYDPGGVFKFTIIPFIVLLVTSYLWNQLFRKILLLSKIKK